MKNVKIADATLCRENNSFSFKEKIEIARQLEKLCVDIIELPETQNSSTDILLVRTISAFVKNSTLSVGAGSSEKSIDEAAESLSAAGKGTIRIELPVSPVNMEYTCHKKPAKMLEWIEAAVKKAKATGFDAEFCAEDATRAEKDFLICAIKTAGEAGADKITVCDTAGSMLPDDFAAFVKEITEITDLPVGIKCSDKAGLAAAQAILAVRSGAACVKCAVGGETVSLDTFASIIKNLGNDYGITSSLRYTELHRIVSQINWITDNAKNEKSTVTVSTEFEGIRLDKNDDEEAVLSAVTKLGYDLSKEDCAKVYEEFLRVAAKKNVGAKELDAIVASAALQVPSAYKLVSYIINNGNIITASAHIVLERDGQQTESIELGDGPIDASFIAIDRIIGRHYELDDFQIQAVTEGKEAMGSALVKLRSGGRLYSGNGISTDIIGASIRAYLNAINKIVYEETEA
jgi:2-isopropylmalate synthase